MKCIYCGNGTGWTKVPGGNGWIKARCHDTHRANREQPKR